MDVRKEKKKKSPCNLKEEEKKKTSKGVIEKTVVGDKGNDIIKKRNEIKKNDKDDNKKEKNKNMDNKKEKDIIYDNKNEKNKICDNQNEKNKSCDNKNKFYNLDKKMNKVDEDMKIKEQVNNKDIMSTDNMKKKNIQDDNDEIKKKNYNKLRRKLKNLNYTEYLCVLCTPLVQIIFDDLIQAIHNFQKLSDKYEELQQKCKLLKNEEIREGEENDKKDDTNEQAGKMGTDKDDNQIKHNNNNNNNNNNTRNDNINVDGNNPVLCEMYENKIKELNKRLDEECKLKEYYILENKKLEISLNIIKPNKKKEDDGEENDTSSYELSLCDTHDSNYNRITSYDDIELDKKKKMYQRIGKKVLKSKQTSIINDHTLSLGKELSYYKNLCKEFKIELEILKNGPKGGSTTQMEDNVAEGNDKSFEEKDQEINYLKERLHEYEIEIRKLNELRLINGIKEQKELKDNESFSESMLNENYHNQQNDKNEQNTYNMDDPDNNNNKNNINNSFDLKGTKNDSNTFDVDSLHKIINTKNNEIYHLKNRVVLLETQLEIKNDDEKEFKEIYNGKIKGDNIYFNMNTSGESYSSTKEVETCEEVEKKRKSVENIIKDKDNKLNNMQDEYKNYLELDELRVDMKLKEENIEELERIVVKLKNEIKEERRKSEKYERKYNEEKSELAILKEEMLSLEKQIKEKESEFDLNKNTINNLKLESAEFNNIISCSNETKKHLTDYIHNLLNKLSACNEKMNELKDMNILTNQKIEGYKNEIRKLKTDLIDSNNQIDEFATLLDKKDEAIENYKCKLENINNEYSNINIKYNDILKENQNLHIQNSSNNANSTLIIQQLQQEIEILNITNNHLKKIEEDYKIILQEKTIIEDAAIKIQTELKKSVEKIKNLEVYIQTLSVEIGNIKTQRDDSLDALTKVAIDKTQYENELIQSKNIIYELKKQIDEYENNAKFVQNNISEISKIHIKKEEEYTLLKNELKSLRENLNEKNIKLQLLEEKEKKLEQNHAAYNNFHLEAQKKYNSYEKVIDNLKKEIDELNINNSDNIVIIEKLKEELQREQNKTCNNNYDYLNAFSDKQIDISLSLNKCINNNLKSQKDESTHDVRKITDDHKNILNHISTADHKTYTDTQRKDHENVYDNVQNEEDTKYKEHNKNLTYEYNDDFNIFINSNKNKDKSKTKNNIDIKEVEQNVQKYVNDSVKNEGEDKNIERKAEFTRENINKEEPFDEVSMNKEDIKKKETNESINIKKNYDKNDEDLLNSTSSGMSSYLGNNDISLFSSAKLKKMFNLSHTYNKKINADKKMDSISKLKIENKTNTDDDLCNSKKSKNEKGDKNDYYDDMDYDFKKNGIYNKVEKKKKKKVQGNKEYYIHNDIKTNDKQKILIDKKNINKDSINKMDGIIKPFNMKKKYNLDSSFIDTIDKSVYKNNQKNNLENQITSDEENDEKFPLFYVEENKNRIKNNQNGNMNKNKMDMKKGRDVYNVQEEYDEDVIAEGVINMNENKNENNKKYDKKNDKKNDNYNNQKNDIYNDQKDNYVNNKVTDNNIRNKSFDEKRKKKNYNFISQTSYEANSNNSSIVLLDSLSSDMGPNISIDKYNVTKNNEKINNSHHNNNNSKGARNEYNNILYSSNDYNNIKKGTLLLCDNSRDGKMNTYNGKDNKNKYIYDNDYNMNNTNGKLDISNENKKKYATIKNNNLNNNNNNNNNYYYDNNYENYDNYDHVYNKGIIRNEPVLSNKSKIKKDLYNKYMDVLKSLKSEEMDASVNTTNNKTIDFTNDFTKPQENSTSILSSSKTLQKDSLLSNLSKFKFNEELHEFSCDPLTIIKPIEESNRDYFE
ncbi:conserved Plasmodium protein, unknown function [Plasmodium reichenowi]|uniref:Uncharacterized protein n=1 Tax=Plasmodium reichenowi TaxID=5854 RepID=A0A2P9D7L5_PLARE|nr:conserved Plasmodium protein, unknown function [Plasmodium reichenowi]